MMIASRGRTIENDRDQAFPLRLSKTTDEIFELLFHHLFLSPAAGSPAAAGVAAAETAETSASSAAAGS